MKADPKVGEEGVILEKNGLTPRHNLLLVNGTNGKIDKDEIVSSPLKKNGIIQGTVVNGLHNNTDVSRGIVVLNGGGNDPPTLIGRVNEAGQLSLGRVHSTSSGDDELYEVDFENDVVTVETTHQRSAVVNGGTNISNGTPLKNGTNAKNETPTKNGVINGGIIANGHVHCNGLSEKGGKLQNGEVRMDRGKSDGESTTPLSLSVSSLSNDPSLILGVVSPICSNEKPRSVSEFKEAAFCRLQEELTKAHRELQLRDEEVGRLSRIRDEVEAELEDLTASLFQEAHNMVREANVKQATAERALKESEMQVEVLQAEVSALKTLVLTSTPSRPNPHLHPQIAGGGPGGSGLFNRKHRRSPSHFNLKYGRESSPPESPSREAILPVTGSTFTDNIVPQDLRLDWEQVDPQVHKEFLVWRQNPKLDKTDPFIDRVYAEDIGLCLSFSNQELATQVQQAVEDGTVYIEDISDKTKSGFPKKCALLEATRQCHYRMKLGDQDQWHHISTICRNRITAVCDFLNYLKYIERGLVKSSVNDVYWEIVRLRKQMVLARLGIPS